jgi:hypothetical protein
MSELPRVLVTDFDSTITQNDFSELVRAHLLPPGGRATGLSTGTGELHTSKPSAAIRGNSEGWAAVCKSSIKWRSTRTWPLPSRACDAGWHIVIASAGCR